MNLVPLQACWDYVNANMHAMIPMTEEQFAQRPSPWDQILDIGPDISGNRYRCGIRHGSGVRGCWDPQRSRGALSPGA